MPVFETIRVMHGAAPFLEGHLERLHRDALALGLAAPGRGVRHVVSDAVRDLVDGVLRVEWDGFRVDVATREAEGWGGVRLSIADGRHRGYAHKTTDREWLDRELASALQHGVDEAVFLTADGSVAEGAVSAVGLVMREAVVFPPLDLAILPSIGRRRVIDLARELGVRVRERRVTPEDLRRHPVFVVNAVRGVGLVVSLGGKAVPDAGLIGMLARAFWPSG